MLLIPDCGVFSCDGRLASTLVFSRTVGGMWDGTFDEWQSH